MLVRPCSAPDANLTSNLDQRRFHLHPRLYLSLHSDTQLVLAQQSAPCDRTNPPTRCGGNASRDARAALDGAGRGRGRSARSGSSPRRIRSRGHSNRSMIRVQTIADVIDRFRDHPESKSDLLPAREAAGSEGGHRSMRYYTVVCQPASTLVHQRAGFFRKGGPVCGAGGPTPRDC